ncbi:MAG: hypothetical protein U0694_07420 [Anaerolineae bacterium]
MNVKPPHVEYTPYHLVEHLRICQWDILDYMRNPNYKEMPWPAGYWPTQMRQPIPPRGSAASNGF